MSRATGAATERVLLGIACVITFVWAVATLVQVVLPDHPVPGYANLVMMTVATCFFGGSIISSKRSSNEKDAKERADADGRLLDAAIEKGRRLKGGEDG